MELGSSFLELIRYFDNLINESLRGLIDDFDLGKFLILVLLAFIYGIIHSAGPGHSKTLVVSYFLKEKQPLRKSFFLSMVISVIHVGSAILLAFILTYFLKGLGGMFKIKLQSYIMLASGILITLVGLGFLLTKIFTKQKHEHHLPANNKNIFLIGISAGIVPCPVALMIMLFTISQGIVWQGIILVLSMSLGMLALLMPLGMVSIKARDGLLKLTTHKLKDQVGKVSVFIEYLSIIFIILIGVMMIFSNAIL